MKQFIFSPLKSLLGSPGPELKIGDIIRERKIFIVNLGTLDRNSANLVGKLIVLKIQHAVFHQKPSACIPHYLYADEFQNFQTSAFDVILSEAGGFKLCLTLANQGLYQLEDRIKDSLFTNVNAARIAFRISHKDIPNWKHLLPSKTHPAPIPGSQDQFWYIEPETLANLAPHLAFMKIADLPPVLTKTPAPLPEPTADQVATAEQIKLNTLKAYGPRATTPGESGNKRTGDNAPSNTADNPHNEENGKPRNNNKPDPDSTPPKGPPPPHKG